MEGDATSYSSSIGSQRTTQRQFFRRLQQQIMGLDKGPSEHSKEKGEEALVLDVRLKQLQVRSGHDQN